MIIDKAIEKYKNQAEWEQSHNNTDYYEEYEQIVKWLEKLQKIEQIVSSKAFHIIPDKPNCVDSEHELRIRYNEICEVLADDRNY